MVKLTWQKFENTVINTQDDFENLCRIFFKYFFFGKDSKVILSQQPNNPGIEINPITRDGTDQAPQNCTKNNVNNVI